MKLKRSIILIVLGIFLTVSAMGSAFAEPTSTCPYSFEGSLYDYVSSTTVHVNDTFTITVTAENSGLGDWENVMIYAPIPEGLQYISHVMPDINSQDYYLSTGIWNMQQMKWTGRGHHKSMILTVKALPESAGKTLSFSSRFTSLIFVDVYGNHTRTDMVANGWAPTGNTVNIKVLPADIGPSDGPNTVSGNGTGRGSGNGINIGDGNGTFTDAINSTARADNSTNSTVNAETIGMQNTGTPINYLILAILAVISGLILPRRK